MFLYFYTASADSTDTEEYFAPADKPSSSSAATTSTSLVVCNGPSTSMAGTSLDTTRDGLDEFRESLAKFTQYSTARPLATLSYASDIYNTSSIVSR